MEDKCLCSEGQSRTVLITMMLQFIIGKGMGNKKSTKDSKDMYFDLFIADVSIS